MKAHSILFVLFVFPFFVFGQSLHDSLVVYYPFNGDATDLSGNELNGVMYGPVPTDDRFGTANGALYFDGSDNYIALLPDARFEAPIPLSFAIWVKTLSDDEFKNKFFVTDYQDDNYSGCWMTLNALRELSLNFGENGGDAGNASRRSKISNVSVPNNEWVHLTGVIRGATDMSLYINGEEVDGFYSGSGSTAIGYSDAVGRIGCVPPQTASSFDKYFLGAMDDFAMWNRDLTSEEVLELYTNGINVSAVDEMKSYQLSLYPNPCHQAVWVSWEVPLKGLRFQLYQPSGNIVVDQPLPPGGIHQMDLSFLQAGIYLYKMSNEQQAVKSGKLIINN